MEEPSAGTISVDRRMDKRRLSPRHCSGEGEIVKYHSRNVSPSCLSTTNRHRSFDNYHEDDMFQFSAKPSRLFQPLPPVVSPTSNTDKKNQTIISRRNHLSSSPAPSLAESLDISISSTGSRSNKRRSLHKDKHGYDDIPLWSDQTHNSTADFSNELSKHTIPPIVLVDHHSVVPVTPPPTTATKLDIAHRGTLPPTLTLPPLFGLGPYDEITNKEKETQLSPKQHQLQQETRDESHGQFSPTSFDNFLNSPILPYSDDFYEDNDDRNSKYGNCSDFDNKNLDFYLEKSNSDVRTAEQMAQEMLKGMSWIYDQYNDEVKAAEHTARKMKEELSWIVSSINSNSNVVNNDQMDSNNHDQTIATPTTNEKDETALELNESSSYTSNASSNDDVDILKISTGYRLAFGGENMEIVNTSDYLSLVPDFIDEDYSNVDNRSSSNNSNTNEEEQSQSPVVPHHSSSSSSSIMMYHLTAKAEKAIVDMICCETDMLRNIVDQVKAETSVIILDNDDESNNDETTNDKDHSCSSFGIRREDKNGNFSTKVQRYMAKSFNTFMRHGRRQRRRQQRPPLIVILLAIILSIIAAQILQRQHYCDHKTFLHSDLFLCSSLSPQKQQKLERGDQQQHEEPLTCYNNQTFSR